MGKVNYKLVFFSMFFSIFFSFILIQNVGRKLNPIILNYSKVEAKRFGTFIVNSSLDQNFLNSLDWDVFNIHKDSEGKIELIDFKAKEANYLLEEITKKIQSDLILLENGKIDKFELADTFYGISFKNRKKGIVCEIPAGVISSNSLIANTGPIIPVKLNFIGQVNTNLSTKLDTYGINSVYMKTYIHVEVSEQITMPLSTKEVPIIVDIPLDIKIIQGTIPDYYQNSLYRDSSSFSLPIG